MKRNILNVILDSHEALEIAENNGYSCEEDVAASYFNEIYYESEWELDELPKYSRFIKSIEAGDLYYDYGAGYYFLVKSGHINENKSIRLSESELHNLIKESVKTVLNEIGDSPWGQFALGQLSARKNEPWDEFGIKNPHRPVWDYAKEQRNKKNYRRLPFFGKEVPFESGKIEKEREPEQKAYKEYYKKYMKED